jgi:hypothetical protein
MPVGFLVLSYALHLWSMGRGPLPLAYQTLKCFASFRFRVREFVYFASTAIAEIA